MVGNEIIKNKTKEAILAMVGEEVLTTEQLIEKLFKSNVMSEKHCKTALIRKRFYELIKNNPEMKHVEARFICEEEFGAKETFVKDCIYYYRKVDFSQGF